MSTGALLSIAGTVVGGIVGGPIGATIGGYIGSTFGPNVELEGPRLDDLRVVSSAYGLDIPLVYGPYNRISGNIIWSTGLQETRQESTQGGKGGGGGVTTVSYTYSTSVAIALGAGPCQNIARIWANGKLLWSADTVAAEVARLQALATALEAEAVAAEAAAAANPGDDFLQVAAQVARDNADTAAAASAAATAAFAAMQIDGQSWSLQTGTGLPAGPLGYLAFYPGTTTQDPDPRIEADRGAGNAPAYRNTCYIVLGSMQLGDYGNAVPNIEVELSGLDITTVGGVLRDVCQRSGMSVDEYAVRSQVDQRPISGYVVARAQNSMAAVTPLQAAFAFDTVEQNGEVRFVARGSQPLATIPRTHMAARDRQDGQPAENRYALERTPDHELLREAALTYRDMERDYQDNTQRASRVRGGAFSKREEQLALTFDTDEARRVVDRLLWGGWVDRVPASIAVSDRYRILQAGDVVMLEVSEVYVPFRIERRTRGINGQIALELRMEDPHVYTGSTDGQTADVPSQVAALVGETFIIAFNAPLLGTDQTDTGFTWAMDAELAGWRGGALYRSIDTGVSYTQVEASNLRNITGSVAAALPTGPTDVWDRVNTISVQLLHEDHELESLPETDILNGKNGVWLGASDGSHGEVLQFATATLISSSPRVYELSDLLRGRRATEHETELHGPNEVLVFLERDVMRSTDYGLSDWDRSRRYKGVSAYDSPDNVYSYQTFTNVGERAKPRSPVNGQGSRDGVNNLTMTWDARVRGLQLGIGYGTLPLDDPDVWELDIVVGAAVVRTIDATAQTASYSAAEQTADGITPGNPVTVRIYQISASRGRGHAGEFIL